MSVKCEGCGYLGVMHHTTRQLLGADFGIRQRGYSPSDGNGNYYYDEQPVCFRHVVDFRSPDEGGHSRDEGKTRSAVQKQRECGEFTEWIPGLTPQEHWAMMREKDLLEWKASREDADREFHRKEAETNRKHNQRSLIVSIGAVVVAVLTSVASVAGAIWAARTPVPIHVTQDRLPVDIRVEHGPQQPQEVRITWPWDSHAPTEKLP